MYWRRGHWQEIPDDKARIKVEKELGKELAKTKGQQGTLLVYCPNASTEIGDCPPSSVTSRTDVFECRLVTHVAYRALPFYSKNKSENTAAKTDIDKDWCIYRFTC